MAQFDFLLGSQTDPTRTLGQFMTLAALSRQNRMGAEDERTRTLDRESDMLAAQAYQKARTTGDINSVLSDLSGKGEAGALATRKLVKFAQEQDKAASETRYKDAETESKKAGAEKDRAGIKIDALKQFSALGTAIASGQAPVNDATQSAAYEIARSILPEQVVRTMPADPVKFKDWMTIVSSPESLSKIAKETQDIAQSKATTAKTELETQQLPAELRVRQDNARAQGISASAAASNASTARDRLNFDRTKEVEDRWVNDLERGIQVNQRTGETRPITAGGAPIGPKKPAAGNQSEKALAAIALAEPLIDKATGSYGGAVIDRGARVFGSATDGAKAAAELKVLEGAIMANQPRMEGPQSDKDVALYRQMAGQIGDETVPPEQKKAALATIKTLHQKYGEIGGTAKGPAKPQLGERRDGYIYKGGDPASPSSWEKL